jgi:OmpA-OmpF porin, OOP family
MPRAALRLSIAACLFAIACETPVVAPVEVRPITPGSGEEVVTDQSILIVDSSGSISQTRQFPHDKALTQSLIAAMPNGSYRAGAIAFGGSDRQVQPVATFDRAKLSAWASKQTYLKGATPLDDVLKNAGLAREETRGHAAITVVSDGWPTDSNTGFSRAEFTLDAAARLAKEYPGKLCFHTIQVGSYSYGTAFLQKLSQVTDCGSHRSVSSLTTAAAIEAFQREVYLGRVQVAAAPTDSDGDGVIDDRDACPRTPKGVRVDPRGCWVAEHLLFEHDSAVIAPSDRERLLAAGLPILEQNPDLRVSVDGHTDSSGEAAYNEKLSKRRAEAVRNFFIENGVAPSRLEARGFGESQPAAPNDSPENMQLNRRVEFTPL